MTSRTDFATYVDTEYPEICQASSVAAIWMDRYYVMWDEIDRPTKYFKPANYPHQKPERLDCPVERTDITNFFIKFMETDQLGRIAVLHRVLADQKPDGACNPDCITLARMHSTTVDFSNIYVEKAWIHNAHLDPQGNPVESTGNL
jgi:hypothetical protein